PPMVIQMASPWRPARTSASRPYGDTKPRLDSSSGPTGLSWHWSRPASRSSSLVVEGKRKKVRLRKNMRNPVGGASGGAPHAPRHGAARRRGGRQGSVGGGGTGCQAEEIEQLRVAELG